MIIYFFFLIRRTKEAKIRSSEHARLHVQNAKFLRTTDGLSHSSAPVYYCSVLLLPLLPASFLTPTINSNNNYKQLVRIINKMCCCSSSFCFNFSFFFSISIFRFPHMKMLHNDYTKLAHVFEGNLYSSVSSHWFWLPGH